MNDQLTGIASLKNYEFPRIELGQASDIKEFFRQIVMPQFANVNAIKQQHKALLEYINSDQPTFFIRAHGSQKPANYGLLRRGFLTRYNNDVEYAFCDNTFAMMFASIKLSGITIPSEALHDYFQKRSVICGFSQTSSEKELAIFRREHAYYSNLNTNGWYLAHINSVGECYADMKFSAERDYSFPRGERQEWDNEKKIRDIGRAPSEKELSLLKAHFVRFIHPLNNFLVPKRSRIKYNRGTQIGEEAELISYVSQYIQNVFPDEYSEMKSLIFKEDLPLIFSDPISDISWGEEMPQSQKQKKMDVPQIISKQTSTKEISTLTLLRRMGSEAFIYYYLPLKSNVKIEVKKLASFCPKSSNWTEKSKRSRASVAKRIFKEDRVQEALELILQQNLNQNLLLMAKRYYDELTNEIIED